MKKRHVMDVIECSGSDYDIGKQYGEQARENLRKSLSLMYYSMKHMPYQAGKADVTKAARKYLENVRAFDPGAIERVKGMAEGAAISFDEAFALQCYSELFVNYPGLAALCSSFAAAGPATKGGITIIGQNADWHPDSTLNLVRIRHDNGTKMLGLFLNGCGSFYLTSYGLGKTAQI